MQLELVRPKNYDKVAKCIDDQDWDIKDMIFHIVQCLDLVSESTEPVARYEVLKLIGARYGLHHRGSE